MKIIILLTIILLIPTTSLSKILCTNNNTEEQCLACNIYYEARNQTLKSQLAVALVTKNRVLAEKYPNSYCEVVWQRRQFSWTHDGRSDKIYENNAWQVSVNLAKIVLQNDISIKNITKNTLWYHREDVKPVWINRLRQVAVLERHIFYENKFE